MVTALDSIKTIFIYSICSCVPLSGQFMKLFHIPATGAYIKNTEKTKKTFPRIFVSVFAVPASLAALL